MEGGTDWFVREEDKLLLNKLLLERISLTGICRVCQVSLPWLLSYLKGLYAALPDDLNADLRLPPQQAYLDERLAAEVERLMAKKKTPPPGSATKRPSKRTTPMRQTRISRPS